MAHLPGHSPTAQQLATFNAFTPQQQTTFSALSPQQRQGLAGPQQGPIPPPTGLIGSEQAIQGGLGAQLGLLAQGIGGAQGEIDIATQQARGDITQGFGQATGAINPFIQGGAEASQLQAAQSGALGPEAQAQAFQNFQQSPGQQFALQQAEQASLRNAAATQGLGGGNIQRELQRQAIGFAQQDFGNQFNRLGQVAAGGQLAAGLQAGLFGQQGLNLANVTSQGGVNLSKLALQGGTLPAAAVGAAASTLATGRLNTGVNLANAVSGISTGQSNLQTQLGSGLANQFGQGSVNIANLASGTGAQSAQLQQNMATLLANSGIGVGSTAAQFTNLASQFDAGGILGQNTAVQNTLQQLLQLIPQGGGSNTPPPQIPAAGSNFGGGTTPAFNAGAIA